MGTRTITYQFQIDRRPAGPIRDKWRDAAEDAVNGGYASWGGGGAYVHLDETQGAEIVRLRMYPRMSGNQ